MAKKCRLIWDACTPTRQRRPTTVKDIEEDIFVKNFEEVEDMIDELIDMIGFDLEDLDFEEDASIEEQIEELLKYFNDPSDGSPNILYCSIDGKELEGTLPYGCLIDSGLNLETCTRKAVIDCIKSSYDDDDYEYDDQHFSEDINTAYEDEDEDEFYFGRNFSQKYGDKIAKALKGKTISKRRDKADEPGGVRYEAQKLGILWDEFIMALEGMCHEGRAKETSDSTYFIKESITKESTKDDDNFQYRLLSRLQSDCKYFLSAGNGSEKHLWAGSVKEQIEKMIEIYNSLKEKPEWINLNEIKKLEKEMLAKLNAKTKDSVMSSDSKIDEDWDDEDLLTEEELEELVELKLR